MTERTAWLVVVAFVLASIWFLAGAVLTISEGDPAPTDVTPATASPAVVFTP